MKREILTLSELNEKGVKVARLAGNRDLNEKAVKAKMKSMREYGQLVPAIIVDASTAIKNGLEVVDFTTGEEIKDGNNYVVLLDANHRFEAHSRLLEENKKVEPDKLYKGEFYFVYSLNPSVSIEKTLAEINIATTPWKGADYVKGVTMMIEEELPTLDFVSDLTTMGYSLDAASKWATFGSKINKTVLVRAINGNIDDVLKKSNGINRGRILVEAARKSFSAEFLKSRTLIDWIIGKYEDTDDTEKAAFTNDMSRFLSNVQRENTEKIEKAKGTRGGKTKEIIIYEELNILWKNHMGEAIN